MNHTGLDNWSSYFFDVETDLLLSVMKTGGFLNSSDIAILYAHVFTNRYQDILYLAKKLTGEDCSGYPKTWVAKLLRLDEKLVP